MGRGGPWLKEVYLDITDFISCKSGKMTAQQTLHALYELDAVAKKFGGKYAKRILVSVKNIRCVY